METKTIESLPNFTNEIRNAYARWFRLSNDIFSSTMKLGQPLLEAYFKGLSDVVPKMNEMAKTSCKIPETECPPYCVCNMEWDTCEGSKASGTIEIINTGKKSKNFTLSADSFRSTDHNSGIMPQFTPNNFTLAPGEKKTVTVDISVGNTFESGDLYHTEVKIRGRYEQCVRLNLTARRKSTPSCKVEHGEIPRQIVAHNWYDHFQCEELCFEPIRDDIPGASGKPQKHEHVASKVEKAKKD